MVAAVYSNRVINFGAKVDLASPNGSKPIQDLTASYQNIFLSDKITKQKAVTKIVTVLQSKEAPATPITDETLLVSLNSVKTPLILINIFNNRPDIAKIFFGEITKTVGQYISLELITPQNVSAAVLQSELGKETYQAYRANPTQWLADAKNKEKMNMALESTNNSATDIIKRDVEKSRTALWSKFSHDVDFAFSFFSQWSNPNLEAIPSKENLRIFALKNPGAALGILLNPTLSPLLTSELSNDDYNTLLENARDLSTQKPQHQHYLYETLKAVLKIKKRLTLDFAKIALDTPDPVGLIHDLIDRNGNDQTFITFFREQSSALLVGFEEKLVNGDYKEKEYTLEDMMSLTVLSIKHLISVYQDEKTNPVRKEKLYTDIVKIFEKPALVEKLNLSKMTLIKFAPPETHKGIQTVLEKDKAKGTFRKYIFKQEKISDDLAFVIVNRPELWANLNPNQYHSYFKRKTNQWFGWYKDEFETEVNKLKNFSPIFKAKLEGSAILPSLSTLPKVKEPRVKLDPSIIEKMEKLYKTTYEKKQENEKWEMVVRRRDNWQLALPPLTKESQPSSPKTPQSQSSTGLQVTPSLSRIPDKSPKSKGTLLPRWIPVNLPSSVTGTPGSTSIPKNSQPSSPKTPQSQSSTEFQVTPLPPGIPDESPKSVKGTPAPIGIPDESPKSAQGTPAPRGIPDESPKSSQVTPAPYGIPEQSPQSAQETPVPRWIPVKSPSSAIGTPGPTGIPANSPQKIVTPKHYNFRTPVSNTVASQVGTPLPNVPLASSQQQSATESQGTPPPFGVPVKSPISAKGTPVPNNIPATSPQQVTPTRYTFHTPVSRTNASQVGTPLPFVPLASPQVDTPPPIRIPTDSPAAWRDSLWLKGTNVGQEEHVNTRKRSYSIPPSPYQSPKTTPLGQRHN